MSRFTPIHTVHNQFHRLENHSGWRILAQLDNEYIKDRNALAGYLTDYAWKLITRMVKPISFDRFYELLEEQVSVYMETNRVDSKYILKKVMLTKRKTYPFPLYKIEIGSSIETLCAIFPPCNEAYKRDSGYKYRKK